jgi:deoxycytidine triphosphate deaminase
MPALAEELIRALRFRLDSLSERLGVLKANLGGGRGGMRTALGVIERYPPWLLDIAAREWERAPDDESRLPLVGQLFEQVRDRVEFVEAWFGSSSSIRIPIHLLRAVERGCTDLGIGPRSAVLAPGSPSNFETLVPNLAQAIFEPVDPYDTPPPEEIAQVDFVLMRVPLLEGGEAFWWPVVCGHELAHVALSEKATLAVFDVGGRLDWERLEAVHFPPLFPEENHRLAVHTVASSWAEEIICDFYAAQRFGPAGVASLLEFLSVVGAVDEPSDTHPPGWLRAVLLTRWCGQPENATLRRVLDPWTELAASPKPSLPEWADALTDSMLGWGEHFSNAVAEWPTYPWAERENIIAWASSDIAWAIPPRPVAQVDGAPALVDADVVNAAWMQRMDERDLFVSPVGRLAGKSLDTLEFVTQWLEEEGHPQDVTPLNDARGKAGMLSDGEIRHRLLEGPPSGIAITPLMGGAIGGAGVDVRLGNKFIVFRRSATDAFHPLKEDDPRSMQDEVEKSWGDSLVLHPNELVLASTLEYLWLPGDISAQVITRSSFGRLGLITATAVEVNPFFHGCLTLELVNLGEVPLHLTPGSRIAQLVFINVSPVSQTETTRYQSPTGPEFSRVREDSEAGILKRLRDRHDSVNARPGGAG